MVFLFLVSCAYAFNDYIASSITESIYGISGDLDYVGEDLSSAVVKKLQLNITYESADYARVRITDPSSIRWEVPDVVASKPAITNSTINFVVNLSTSPFSLRISRKSDRAVVFNLKNFKFNDQDIVWENDLGYPISVFGLGERVSSFKLRTGHYALFARDFTGVYDNGQSIGFNMYSSQPVYLAVNSTGEAFGSFLLNSNALEAYVNSTGVQYRTIGGIVDFFVFLGPSPIDVLKQYHALIGFPAIPPYWTLGWHNCRWGYEKLEDLEYVLGNYTQYRLPLDGVWADIDYMYEYRDFTVDNSRYNPQLFKVFIDKLHDENKHFVPIVDAGIANISYPAFDEGLEMNVYIRSPNHEGPFIGKVWPGYAVFVDWFHPNSTAYWHKMLGDFRSLIEFDGIWTDMNEASNFCEGECGYSPVINDLPFTPGFVNLNERAIDLAAKHYRGLIEYDVHSLFGKMMAEKTSTYFSEVLKVRPFVLSRSSFAGSQQFAFKWLGDNYSLWEYLRYSITGVFNFQIFGIPMIGADICGFSLDTTEELCARWFQMGTLYPFSRDHNSKRSRPQEPWAFGQTLMQAAYNSIRTKYSLMPYIYTGMFSVSLEGGAFYQPSFFEFPNDYNLINTHNTDHFMLGKALIVHPCVYEGKTTVDAYFPADLWYNWYSGEALQVGTRTVELDAPLRGYVNIHVRGGCIVPKSDGYLTAMNLEDLRFYNISLIVAADGNGNANGNIVFDDGKSINTIEDKKYTLVNFLFQEDKEELLLTVKRVVNGYERTDKEWPRISQVSIYDCQKKIDSVTRKSDGSEVSVSIGYNKYAKVCWVYLKDVIPDKDEEYSFHIKS